MKFLSVCSGIEAASQAWHPLGWKAVAFSEIEKFPSAVLAHHYPDTPNLGDMTKFNEWPDLKPDILVGGTPCQAFSVAGLREGLNDPRGNLTLTFLAMAAKYRPRWLVWENVPGVLSDRTNAFGHLLAGLGELGYGWAYRVLDAQYFGVAQRRKRVFVVASLGGWERAAEVLFEPESMSGNPPPSRETGEGIAPTLAARTRGGGGLGTDFDCDGGCSPIQEPGKRTGRSTNDTGCGVGIGVENDPMFTLQAGAVHGVAHTLKAEGFDASEDGTGRGTPLVSVNVSEDISPCLGVAPAASSQPNVGNGQGTVVGTLTTRLANNAMGAPEVDGGHYMAWPKEITPTLNASFGSKHGLEDQHALNGAGLFVPHGATVKMAVRRLTPTECERLQGFPDGYTDIPWKIWSECGRKGWSYEAELHKRGMVLRGPNNAQGCPDGPRYKALGNSMAVPVMAWIGKRIAAVEAPQESPEDWS